MRAAQIFILAALAAAASAKVYRCPENYNSETIVADGEGGQQLEKTVCRAPGQPPKYLKPTSREQANSKNFLCQAADAANTCCYSMFNDGPGQSYSVQCGKNIDELAALIETVDTIENGYNPAEMTCSHNVFEYEEYRDETTKWFHTAVRCNLCPAEYPELKTYFGGHSVSYCFNSENDAGQQILKPTDTAQQSSRDFLCQSADADHAYCFSDPTQTFCTQTLENVLDTFSDVNMNVKTKNGLRDNLGGDNTVSSTVQVQILYTAVNCTGESGSECSKNGYKNAIVYEGLGGKPYRYCCSDDTLWRDGDWVIPEGSNPDGTWTPDCYNGPECDIADGKFQCCAKIPFVEDNEQQVLEDVCTFASGKTCNIVGDVVDYTYCPDNNSGLSDAALGGIIGGSVGGVALIGGALYWRSRKGKNTYGLVDRKFG